MRRRWVQSDDGRVLAESVRVADTFWRRLVGLQGRRSLPAGEVLWLSKCTSVHTAWMRFAIDVIFLDDQMRVLEVRPAVRPWRIVIPRVAPESGRVRHVIERQTREGQDSICVGTRTRIETTSEMAEP